MNGDYDFHKPIPSGGSDISDGENKMDMEEAALLEYVESVAQRGNWTYASRDILAIVAIARAHRSRSREAKHRIEELEKALMHVNEQFILASRRAQAAEKYHEPSG